MWELIEKEDLGKGIIVKTKRLSVPNGWIVRTITINENGEAYIDQMFVEDRFHSWKINT